MVKLAFLVLAFGAIGLSGPMCLNTPDYQKDGVGVCSDAPGLGDKIYLSGASFVSLVHWENLNASVDGLCGSGLPGDCDYNDIMAKITGDYLTGQITLEYVNGLSAYPDSTSWVGGGVAVSRINPGPQLIQMPWVVGQELVLQNFTGVGTVWQTGEAGRNADNQMHAIVSTITMFWDPPGPPPPTEIPEPSTFALLVMGLSLIALGIASSKRK